MDESCHQLKILKMSTLQILIIHLYTKFTLKMGLKTLNSGKTLYTFICAYSILASRIFFNFGGTKRITYSHRLTLVLNRGKNVNIALP